MKTKITVLCLLPVFMVACGNGAPTSSTAEPSAPQQSTQPAPTDLAAPPPREFAEISADQFSPAFTRDTVIKLNGIVRRSLDTIRAFDSEINAIRTAINASLVDDASEDTQNSAKTALQKVAAWRDAAQAAQKDMNAAVDELKASGETYNVTLLAGMVDFVDDVAAELTAEAESLAAKLN